MKKRDEKIKELEEKEKAIPFLEQFDQVKIGIDVLVETLQNTSKDLNELKDKIEEVLGESQEQNRQFQNTRQWARSVYSNSDWEPSAPSQPKKGFLTRMKDAIGKKIGWINDIEKDVSQFAGFMKELESAVHARDGSPSEQLKAFQNYFTSITGSLKKYAETIPLIKVFLVMFDYYEKAIGCIIKSVEIIEKEYARKDAMLRELGPEYNNVRYLWPKSSPREELAKQKAEIQKEIDKLEKELEPYVKECGSQIKQKNLTFQDELLLARQTALKKCGPEFNIKSEDELLNNRNKALMKMNKYYSPTKDQNLTANKEVAWIENRHAEWKYTNIQIKEAEIKKLEQELAIIENKFQKFRKRELTLTIKEQESINKDRNNKKVLIQRKKKELSDSKSLTTKIEKELTGLLEAQHNLDDYHFCVKQWMEDLAKTLNWDPFWLSYVNPDLFPKSYKKDEVSAAPVGKWLVEFDFRPSHDEFGIFDLSYKKNGKWDYRFVSGNRQWNPKVDIGNFSITGNIVNFDWKDGGSSGNYTGKLINATSAQGTMTTSSGYKGVWTTKKIEKTSPSLEAKKVAVKYKEKWLINYNYKPARSDSGSFYAKLKPTGKWDYENIYHMHTGSEQIVDVGDWSISGSTIKLSWASGGLSGVYSGTITGNTVMGTMTIFDKQQGKWTGKKIK
jgi:hypothetical protein